MRFNIRRIVRGANMVRHAAKSMVPKKADDDAAPAPSVSPKKPQGPRPKTTRQAMKPTTNRFKNRMKAKASAPVGPKGKPLNRQQRQQAGVAAKANWRKRQGVK